jgi:hypothetical protein
MNVSEYDYSVIVTRRGAARRGAISSRSRLANRCRHTGGEGGEALDLRFRRKSDLAAELSGLQTRKDLLSKQLLKSEQELAAAVEARQQVLVEGTPVEQPNERPDLVARLRDEVDAVRNAITTVGERITEAEAKLAAEHASHFVRPRGRN